MLAAGRVWPERPAVAQPESAITLAVAAKAPKDFAAQDLAETRMVTPLHSLPDPAPPVPERDRGRIWGLLWGEEVKLMLGTSGFWAASQIGTGAGEGVNRLRSPPFPAPAAGRGRPAGWRTGRRRRRGRSRRGRRRPRVAS